MTGVELKGVSFGYDGGPTVLDGIDLTMDAPGLYCILGPNGVGKSTVVRCIAKILTPTSGDILIDGRSVSEMSYREVSGKVAFVPTSMSDAFSMSVIDTIMVGRHGKHRWGSTEEDLRAVYRAMRLMRIEKLSDKKVRSLSAGQSQKVNIARGLVRETEILMLDEPTSNLDVKYQVYVTEVLRGIARQTGAIVVMICHDLNLAAKYADRIVMMSRPGRIHSVGTPEEIITQETIEEVYGIHATVIRDPVKGVPVVIPGEAIMDDDGE